MPGRSEEYHQKPESGYPILRSRLEQRRFQILSELYPCTSPVGVDLTDIVTWRLKAGTVEPKRTSVTEQRLGNHVSVSENVNNGIPVTTNRITQDN